MLKLARLAPLTQIAVETVRFDTQKIQNPEISGVEYQQGELAGYELIAGNGVTELRDVYIC
jgi:hypothetical protein